MSQLDRNKIIKEFYAKYKSNGKSFTVKHFTLTGLGKSQLYRILTRIDRSEELGRKIGSGRIAEKMPIAKRRKLVNEMKENVGASQRKFAKKYRITHQYIGKNLL